MDDKELEIIVRKLPLLKQRVISVFFRKKKKVLTRREISENIQKKGRALGGVLGGFTQGDEFIMQVSQDRWAINEKYEDGLKKIIFKLDKYIWDLQN